MSRPVLLIEIGAGPLPQVTPAVRAAASWAPPPPAAAEISPPTDVEVKPGVESITISWQASPLAGATYVVWRAPDVGGTPGAWRIVTRTTDTRYTYTDASGAISWWKVTVVVNGVSSGDSSQNPVLPVIPPTTAELIEIQRDIDKEKVDRFNADAAESQKRADAVAELANLVALEAAARAEGLIEQAEALNKEVRDRTEALLNERLAWQAGVSQEAATRESEVESLAYALSQVTAGSGTQFDSRSIWYFNADAEGWTGNGTPTVVDGWLRPADATSFPYIQSPLGLGIDGTAYRFVKLRVKRVGSPVWAGRLQWITQASPIWNEGRSAVAPEPLWDPMGVATLDFQDIPWWPEQIHAIRLQVGAAQDAENYFLLDWVAVGRPTPGAGVAFVQEQTSALVLADLAEASKRESLAAQLRGDYEGTDPAGVTVGLYAAERDARVTADQANARATEVLQARMPAGQGTLATEASVSQESQARADGDSANAEAIRLVQARMPDGDGKVASVQALESVSARVEDTEDGLRAVGERVTSMTAQLEGNHAGDEDTFSGDLDVFAGSKSVYTVIAEGDLAQAEAVERLDASVGQFKAATTTQLQAMATDVSAQAQRIDVVQVELDGKASAQALSQLKSSVDQNADGIEAVAESLQGVRVDLDGKASAQVVQGMEARVVQAEGGVAQVLAKAFLHLIADGGNGPLVGGMELGNNGSVVSLRFLTNSMEIVAPNGAAEGMEWRNGYLRVWKGAAQRIIGPGFGANGDNLIDYFGPNVGAAAASKTNAMMWMDANGSAYFGGQLSAGILRNAVQTTTTQTIGTELVNGPFATNGRVRTVTVSFTRQHIRVQTTMGPSGFVAGAGQNTARVDIYRKVGNNAESLWQVLNVAGSVNIMNEPDGADRATSNWGGSFTVNDTSPSSETMQYRAVISGFTSQDVSHTSGTFQQQTITQSLSMISIEM